MSVFLLIWIIVIVLVVKNENKKRKQRSAMYQQPRQQYGQPRPQQYGQPMQQSYQQSRAQQYGQPVQSRPQQYGQSAQQYQNRGVVNQNMAQMQDAMTRKQQELKQRLQQRYGSQQAGARQGATQGYAGHQGDILSRANANVRENDADRLERELMPENMVFGTLGMQQVTESEFMREINDLIVKGYEANLTFDRDFVSEGIEMLNAYELQTEV